MYNKQNPIMQSKKKEVKTLWTKYRKVSEGEKYSASAVDATLGSVRSFGLEHKRINSDPKQREDRCQ